MVSLKDVNRANLALIIFLNISMYIYILEFGLKMPNISEITVSYKDYGSAIFFLLLVGVLNAQLDHEYKARLIFWRWNNPLPGSFAFSHIMHTDPRIDIDALRGHYSPLPDDPKDQNRLWFKWYRECSTDPSITHVHREYLFTRDWAGLSFLLFLLISPLAYWQMEWRPATGVAVILITEYFLVRRAAKNHGERFVASVLAIKSSKERS